MFHPFQFVSSSHTTVSNTPVLLCSTTINYAAILNHINPSLNFATSKHPLTQPSIPAHNNGKDNEQYDYIVQTDEIIGSATSKEGNKCSKIKNSRYQVLSLLGSGTFGQVFKCKDLETNRIVAVKILKINHNSLDKGFYDTSDSSYMLRLLDHFLFYRHICIVTELLGLSIYDVLKGNRNKVIGLTFNKRVLYQLLTALQKLFEAGIVHCDLKPENILIVDNKPTIKLIDFGSACFLDGFMYTYIQSRHYRSPEIILGLPYDCGIDMWSFGCVVAEMFIGIPIFPGENEYNQLLKIIEMIGMPSKELLDNGKKTLKFFKKVMNGNGQYDYQLLTPQEYAEQNNVPLLPNRKYYRYTSLNEICSHFPLHHHGGKKGSDNETRLQIYDLLSHIFVFDPHKRIKPYEAMNHSFFGQSTNSFTTEQHIPKLPSMPEIVHHIFNQPVSLLYLQKQNYNIENYYQTYLKALYSGYVLNPLHVNPFHYQPLRGGLHFNVSLFKPHSDLDNDELPSIQIRSRCKSVSTSNEMEELPPISLNPVLPLNSPTINPAINYNFNSQSINNTHPNFATPTNTLPSGPTLRTPRANSSLKPPKRCPRQNSFSACSFKTAF
ncbi:Serine/threonine protein kinase prp4 [Entamoeba marina]